MYEHAWSFVNKHIKLRFIGIFYEAIMQKMEFGQAYCKDLINRILIKFILYFPSFIVFLRYFRILIEFLEM
jgi:hypothetical protein